MQRTRSNRVAKCLRLDGDLAKELAHAAVDEGVDQSALVEAAIEQWLDGRGRSKRSRERRGQQALAPLAS